MPRDILEPAAWTVACARKWKDRENILKTEGRALLWAVRHALRSSCNVGKHILFLSDNLPLVLAVTKGRAKSPLLRSILKQLVMFVGFPPN